MAEAIRTTVVPISGFIRTTVVPISGVIGPTVVRIANATGIGYRHDGSIRFSYKLLISVIFFAIQPTPVLGVVPNGKKYLFFPNAWLKIPNLRKFPNQAHNCNCDLYMYC